MFGNALRIVVCVAVVGSVVDSVHARNCYAYRVKVYSNSNWKWSAHHATRDTAEWHRRGDRTLGIRVGRVVNRCGSVGPSDVINTDYARTLSKLLKETNSVYKRARILESWARRNMGKLLQQQLDSVNRAIDKYNAKRRSVQSGQFASHFRGYPSISRIPQSAVRQQVKYVVWYSKAGQNTRYRIGEYDSASVAQRAVRYLQSRYGRRYRFGYQIVRR